MERASKIIPVIAKIMNEEGEIKRNTEIIYDDIYNLLFKELYDKLDEIKYPFTSQVSKKLTEVMENFEIYNKIPWLLEKNIVKISGENEEIIKTIFSSKKKRDVIKNNKNIPLFIFKGKEKKIYIMNYVNKIIEITEEEYKKIQLLYQRNIEISKLVKNYIYVTPEYKYENLVSIIMPKYIKPRDEKYINKLKKYIINEDKFLNKTSQNESFEEILENLNKKNINFDLSIQLENILLDIENYYLNLNNKKKNQMELLTKNLIEIDEKSELKVEIKKHKEKIVYEVENIEEICTKLQKLKNQILDSARKYEEEISDILSCQIEKNIEGNLYIENLLDKFFILLEMKDFFQLKDCILRLKMANYEYFLELEVACKILQKKEVTQHEILSIKNISEKNWEFSKLKMVLSQELEYSEKELIEIVTNIPSKWHKGKENFYLAKKEYNEGKFKQAEINYKKSLELGYLEAGNELINNLKQDKSYDYNLEKIANNLVTEATYAVGKKF